MKTREYIINFVYLAHQSFANRITVIVLPRLRFRCDAARKNTSSVTSHNAYIQQIKTANQTQNGASSNYNFLQRAFT